MREEQTRAGELADVKAVLAYLARRNAQASRATVYSHVAAGLLPRRGPVRFLADWRGELTIIRRPFLVADVAAYAEGRPWITTPPAIAARAEAEAAAKIAAREAKAARERQREEHRIFMAELRAREMEARAARRAKGR